MTATTRFNRHDSILRTVLLLPNRKIHTHLRSLKRQLNNLNLKILAKTPAYLILTRILVYIFFAFHIFRSQGLSNYLFVKFSLQFRIFYTSLSRICHDIYVET